MGDNGARRYKALVFDFDGTLAEVRLDFPEMKRRVAALAAGFAAPRALPPLPPMPALEMIEQAASFLAAEDPEAAARYRAAAHEAVLAMEREAARNSTLFPFTRGVLADLRATCVRTAIITRNCEEAVRIVFPDIDAFCDCLLARDHVPRVKPDPGHILSALDRLAVAPSEALMVGDHPLDVETGRRAGTATAAVWSGNTPRETLVSADPGYLTPDVPHLLDILRREGRIPAAPAAGPVNCGGPFHREAPP